MNDANVRAKIIARADEIFRFLTPSCGDGKYVCPFCFYFYGEQLIFKVYKSGRFFCDGCINGTVFDFVEAYCNHYHIENITYFEPSEEVRFSLPVGKPMTEQEIVNHCLSILRNIDEWKSLGKEKRKVTENVCV